MSLTANILDNSFDSCENVSFDMDDISLNSNSISRKVSTHSNQHNNNNNEDNRIVLTKHSVNIKLIHAISKTLHQVLIANQRLQYYQEILKEQMLSVFSARTIPAIDIDDYLHRIQYYGEMEDNTLIIALILIDRLSNIASIVLSQFNIHRILFAAILIAVKYNEDKIFNNGYYAEIAGVPLEELNVMESDFLGLIGFNLYIDKELFENYYSYLAQIVDKSIPISLLSFKDIINSNSFHNGLHIKNKEIV